MYEILNKHNDTIAYSKRYSVCISYIRNLTETYDGEYQNLRITKMKNKKAKNDSNFDDLYLVRYHNTYIQAGYIDYLDISGEQVFYDNTYALDVLLKYLDTNYPMNKKDRKHLEHTVTFLYNTIKDNEKYTPSLSDLKALEEQYSYYMYGRHTY